MVTRITRITHKPHMSIYHPLGLLIEHFDFSVVAFLMFFYSLMFFFRLCFFTQWKVTVSLTCQKTIQYVSLVLH